MSIETLDWDTVSLRLGNSINNPQINQKNIKESSLTTAIEMDDYKLLQFLTKIKGGLINGNFRRVIWPILLGLDLEAGIDGPGDWESLPPHKDEDQVALDVERSFVYYPQNISNFEKDKLKEKLNTLIIQVLRTYPELSYYQGYHDICTVFLIVFENDLDLCFKVLCVFTLCYLRDFMMPNIDVTIQMLHLIPELTQKVDNDLYKDAMLNTLEPFYCLSPIITLFSHDISQFQFICQIFDFIIANGSVGIVIYLYVSMLSIKKDVIFEKISLLEDSDCFSKQDLLHDSLSKFLRNMNADDINDALRDSLNYMKEYPLQSMRSFNHINKLSVLRTNPLIMNLDKITLHEKVKASDKMLLIKQIEEANKMKIPKNEPLSSIKAVLLNKKNQQLFKMSITIGIISLLLNVLLNKTDTSQLLNNILNIWNNNNDILHVGIRPFKDFFHERYIIM